MDNTKDNIIIWYLRRREVLLCLHNSFRPFRNVTAQVCNHLFDHFFQKTKAVCSLNAETRGEKRTKSTLQLAFQSFPKSRERQPCTRMSTEGLQVLVPTLHYTRWLHWLAPAVGFKQYKSVKSPGLVIQRGETEHIFWPRWHMVVIHNKTQWCLDLLILYFGSAWLPQGVFESTF